MNFTITTLKGLNNLISSEKDTCYVVENGKTYVFFNNEWMEEQQILENALKDLKSRLELIKEKAQNSNNSFKFFKWF